ncbi:hypothetical protein D3C76_1803990 [compost metagenome]
MGGYAVKNVIQRLRLYYHEDYVLQYHSSEGAGTRVEMIIPIMTERQEEPKDD